MGLAMNNHVSTFDHFPGDGWGYWWVGDPDRDGIDQPGGWMYRIFPFSEARELRQLGLDRKPDELTDTQIEGLSRALQVHLPWFNCPTRRDGNLSPFLTDPWLYKNVAKTEAGASISYFANWGSTSVRYTPGPTRLSEGLRRARPVNANGIVFNHSEIRPADVKDGLSKTYLVGEMFWYRAEPGQPHFMESYFGIGTPYASGYVASGSKLPMRDQISDIDIGRWGSSHPSVWNMAMADGSVHGLSFEIESETHERLSNRRDGLVITEVLD